MILKYTLSVISAALLLLNGFAQDDIRTKKLSFGLFASPDVSFRYIEQNNSFGNTTRSFSGAAMLAFTAGGEFIYQVNPYVSFTSGIHYSVKRSRTPSTFYFNSNTTPIFDPDPFRDTRFSIADILIFRCGLICIYQEQNWLRF